MNEARLVKQWKVVESQLNMASELLHDSSLFYVEEQPLGDYRFNLRKEELTQEMYNLELIAKTHGAKSGFWRYLKKVADSIGDKEKSDDYENEFHKALNKNV